MEGRGWERERGGRSERAIQGTCPLSPSEPRGGGGTHALRGTHTRAPGCSATFSPAAPQTDSSKRSAEQRRFFIFSPFSPGRELVAVNSLCTLRWPTSPRAPLRAGHASSGSCWVSPAQRAASTSTPRTRCTSWETTALSLASPSLSISSLPPSRRAGECASMRVPRVSVRVCWSRSSSPLLIIPAANRLKRSSSCVCDCFLAIHHVLIRWTNSIQSALPQRSHCMLSDSNIHKSQLVQEL